jgi:hypothetical protein
MRSEGGTAPLPNLAEAAAKPRLGGRTAPTLEAGSQRGAERIKLIQNKTRGLAPLSLEEQDFLTNIELWVLGKKYREEEKKKEEKKEP